MLDTHDGIGLQGVKNILSRKEIDAMIEKATRKHQAFVGYKSGADGRDEPYEINSTWYGALNSEESGEKTSYQVRRFIASRSIALVLKGVPALYLHGMAGTGNNPEAVKKTGVKRDINRTVIHEEELERALEDPDSKLSHIRRHLRQLGLLRVGNRAFHPNGEQKVLMVSPGAFSVFRTSLEGDQHILTLIGLQDFP
jgi:sucrose phosphorylase